MTLTRNKTRLPPLPRKSCWEKKKKPTLPVLRISALTGVGWGVVRTGDDELKRQADPRDTDKV